MVYLRAITFTLLALSATGFFYHIRSRDILKDKLREAYEALDKAAASRVRGVKKNILRQEGTEKTFMGRIMEGPSKRFVYSGLGRRFPWLTFEMWSIGKLAGAAALYPITYAATRNIVASCAAAAAFMLLLKATEALLALRNYKSVEENMTKFLNLLGSYGITIGELTSVFLQISRYLPDPLRYVLEECYYDVQVSGNLQAALYYMSDKIENPGFKEVIRNIEICSDYSADYKEIISNSRKTIQDEQRAKKERKSMANEYIVNMLLVSGMLLVSFALMGNLIQESVTDIITGTAIGRGCTATIVAIYIYFFVSLSKTEK